MPIDRTDPNNRGIIEHPPESGKFYVRVYTRGSEKWHGHFPKLTTARIFRDTIKAKKLLGQYFPEDYQKKTRYDKTVQGWIEAYMDSCTLKSFRNVRTKAEWWKKQLGKTPLAAVKASDLRQIQADLARAGDWSHATINRYFAFLKRIFTLAVHDDLIAKNPVSSLVFFAEPAGPERFLSEAEEEALSGKMTPDNFEKVEFSLQSGLRLQEQFRLRWDSIDFEHRFAVTGLTKNKTRIIKYMTTRAVEILRAKNTHLFSPYVYPHPKNPSKPLSGPWFKKKVYDPALAAAGIHNANWHTLKHTVASRLVMAGISDRALMEFMGWKDAKMVKRYAHLSPHYMGKVGEILVKTRDKTVQTESKPIIENPQVIEKIGAPRGI